MGSIIRVIDLETTGVLPTDKVCEVAFVDVDAELGEVTKYMFDSLVDPQIPIPPETSAIHHIVDKDVAGRLNWEEASKLVFSLDSTKEVVAFAAHNAKFEKQWCGDKLTGGKPWICTYKCALRLWPDAPIHSNQGLRYWNKTEGIDRQIAMHAHRALPDAYVTAFHVREFLKLAPVEQLIEWSSQPALQKTCHIGKYRGVPWSEVDQGFLAWVADKDFDEDVLFTVRYEMQRRRNAA